MFLAPENQSFCPPSALNWERVVHISISDGGGGAARAAYKTHSALRERGWDSRMLVGLKTRLDDADIDDIHLFSNGFSKARTLFLQKIEQWTGRENLLLPWASRILNHPWVQQATILHFHNLHGGYFPLRVLQEITQEKKIFWSVHDLWPLTGHCYYPTLESCNRWQIGCDACPGLKQDNYYPMHIDNTHKLWHLKARCYSRIKPTFLCPSNWVKNFLRQSPITKGYTTQVIGNGIDTDSFQPVEKTAARSKRGIPQDKKVILFSSLSLESHRKGWGFFREALTLLPARMHPEIQVVIIGDSKSDIELPHGISYLHLPAIRDDRALAELYSASDLYVSPSLAETFGLTFAEAMACETAVLGFDGSGPSSFINDGENGFLAPLKNTGVLAQKVEEILSNDHMRRTVASLGREHIHRNYSLPAFARRVENAYAGRTMPTEVALPGETCATSK